MNTKMAQLLCGFSATALLSGACKKADPAPAARTGVEGKAPTAVPTANSAAQPTTQPTTQPSAQPAAAAKPARPVMPAKLESGGPHTFGRALTKPGAIPVATVLADPGAYAGKEIIVSAKVRTVCQRKGCWMEIAPSAEKGAQGARITFKDYGFFVPRDAAGADARLEGTVAVKKIAKSEVEHLESEGGRFAKKDADGNAHEVRFVATGVELTRR